MFDNNGQPNRVIGVNADITRRKQSEFTYREQRRELYLLSRVSVLGEFTGALAHELNQPLAYPDRIFEPFYTTKENGLGLRLASSRSIATAHDGNSGSKTILKQVPHFIFLFLPYSSVYF